MFLPQETFLAFRNFTLKWFWFVMIAGNVKVEVVETGELFVANFALNFLEVLKGKFEKIVQVWAEKFTPSSCVSLWRFKWVAREKHLLHWSHWWTLNFSSLSSSPLKGFTLITTSSVLIMTSSLSSMASNCSSSPSDCSVFTLSRSGFVCVSKILSSRFMLSKFSSSNSFTVIVLSSPNRIDVDLITFSLKSCALLIISWHSRQIRRGRSSSEETYKRNFFSCLSIFYTKKIFIYDFSESFI